MEVDRHELDADFITGIALGSVLFVGGCIGNVMTVHFIRKNRDLHAPTFILIACLACTDVVAIVTRFFMLIYDVSLYYAKSREATDFLLVFGFTALHCSNMHIVILARLRYKLIVFPLQTVNIGLKTIYTQSAFAWILSVVVALSFELPMIVGVDPAVESKLVLTTGFYLLLSTLIPVLWFHLHKIKALKNITSGPGPSHDVTGKMSVMVSLILAFQIVAIVPMSIAKLLEFLLHLDTHTRNTMGVFSQLTLLLNHSINPVLFFYFSRFRRSNVDDV